MRKIYESLNERLQTVAKDMDKKCSDKDVMFDLLSSYDYQLREAVEEIEKLRELVVKKEMERLGLE